MDCKNIEHFLFLKKTYINILSYLNEILNSYKEISRCNNEESYITQLNKYKEEILNTKYLIDDISYKIYNTCKHSFVKDEIDVTSEKSLIIEYCKICEFTK